MTGKKKEPVRDGANEAVGNVPYCRFGKQRNTKCRRGRNRPAANAGASSARRLSFGGNVGGQAGPSTLRHLLGKQIG